MCILFAPDLPGVVHRLKSLVVYEIYTFIFSFSSIFGTLFYRLLCMKRFSLLEHCWTFCLCRYSSLALVVVAFLAIVERHVKSYSSLEAWTLSSSGVDVSKYSGKRYPISSHDILLFISDFRLSLRNKYVLFRRIIDISE